MLKKTFINLFIICNAITLSPNQSQSRSKPSSRTYSHEQLEEDFQRRERERKERNRKLEEDHERREKERKERNRKLEEAHERREKERQTHIQRILSNPKDPEHVILLQIQQTTENFRYLVYNHKALINNYKKALQRHTIRLQGKRYTLLDVISKFSHISSYDRQYHSCQEKGKVYHDRKIAFYIGLEGLSIECLEITNLCNKIKEVIADEMKTPSSKTKKAKKAFNYLKKKAKKEKKLDGSTQFRTEKDVVRGVLDTFNKACGHLDFEHTQTRNLVFPYSYFIELAKVVKTYQNKHVKKT